VVLASDRVRFVPAAICFYRNSSYAQLSKDTSEKGLESLLLSLKLCIQHLLSFEDTPKIRGLCIALLQLYLPYFYPDKQAQLDEVRKLAIDLGGVLSPPDPSWKVDLLTTVLGPKWARRATVSLRRAALATVVTWDQALSTLDR